MSLFTIITVSYNSERTIAQTIESVLNQTLGDLEYIIIDGLSTDSTIQIAESFKDKFIEKNINYKIISEKDNGIYDAMNKGINLAEGEIIGIINSDDYYNLDALEKVKTFYEQENFDVMYADLRIFSDKKEFTKKSKKTKKFKTRFWNHPTTFVTKNVYSQVKYTCQSIYDDLNFMLSIKRMGFKIAIMNETLANFRLGGISNKKKLKDCFERIKLRNSIYKQNGCKGYKLENFMTEMTKYILS